MKRVVITGVGVVSPAGTGKAAFFDALKKEQSVLSRPSLDIDNAEMLAVGEVRDFNIGDYVKRKMTRFMDRASEFAHVAAKDAIEDAKIDLQTTDRLNLGISIGTFFGPAQWGDRQYKVFFDNPEPPVHHYTPIVGYFGNLIGNISIPMGTQGRSQIFLNCDAAGCDAIGYGFQAIQRGKMEVCIAGGAEAPLFPSAYYMFDSINLLAKTNTTPDEASCPFDFYRNGFALAEGSWIVILEDLDHALEREADIYMEVVGYGTSTHVDISSAMRMVLKKTETDPAVVDYVNANGLSTREADKREARAINIVFKDRATSIPVSSAKSMFGHPLGAAGAMQAAVSAYTMQSGIIPPTINYQTQDPECAIDCVPNNSREFNGTTILQSTVGLTGKNSSLLFRRFEA